MKIGIFVTQAYYPKEGLVGVSGHVQIPLKTASLLVESKLDIDLITTKPEGAECLLLDIPNNLKIKTVTHSTKAWPKLGVYKRKSVFQFVQLLKIVWIEKYDIIHFFGGPKTGLLASMIKVFSKKTKIIYSPISEPLPGSILFVEKLKYWLYKKCDLMIPTSQYVAHKWGKIIGTKKTYVIRPGVLKLMSPKSINNKRNTVLFWRNADYNNGADIMVSVVKNLASNYKDLKFVFAIRPGCEYQQSILNLESEYSNVDAHVYPYKNKITIESLLRDALFVVAPFRCLSINPQMSILETLLAGVPVIASDIESNKEVVKNYITGLLVEKNNIEGFTSVIKSLLDNRDKINSLAKNTIKVTNSSYNWITYKKQLINIYQLVLSSTTKPKSKYNIKVNNAD